MDRTLRRKHAAADRLDYDLCFYYYIVEANIISVNRIDRLHAILTHLQSKKKVTARQIADRFNLSQRTVYRDIKALEESGVPVIGEAGSGYSIMEGYRLPPVMFSQDEANALLMGAKLTGQFADTSISKHFDSALFKIKAVLRSGDKEFVEDLDSSIEVFRGHGPAGEISQQHLSNLQQAIAHKKVIGLRYLALYSEESTIRQVEPIGLTYYSTAWHLIAWCRLRNGYRDFRVGRIQQLTVTDEEFDSGAHPSIQEYIQRTTSTTELEEVIVRIDKQAAKYIGDQKYLYGFISSEPLGDQVEMKFLTAYMKAFARWMLLFTRYAEIISPEKLKLEVLGCIRELQQHYNV